MKLKPLTFWQRLGWYWSSTVYGVCVGLIASTSRDDLSVLWEFEPWVPCGTFALMWVAGFGLLRVHLQDRNPTDFADLLGLKKRPRDPS